MPRDLARCTVHHMLDTGELGGGNVVALAVARMLKPHLGESHLWTDPGPAAASAEAAGLTLHPLGQAGLRKAGHVRGRVLEWRLGRRLGRFQPGFAQVSSAFLYGLTARALKASGLCRIVYVQIEDTLPNWRWAFREPPDAIITCAKYLVTGVRAAVADRTRVVAVPNAVDLAHFSPGDKFDAKLKVNAPADRPLLLMLANLAPHKGQTTAIDALARLRQRAVNAECWLAGTERGGGSAFTDELKARVTALGLGNHVKFLGHRADAADLLRAADVFLLPSTNEGLPLSVLEAQAAGVPVLADPTAGVPEAVTDGETGFLIPAHDADGYADKIALLLDHPDVGDRLTAAALARVRRESTLAVFADRMRAVYGELALAMPS